MPLCGFNEKMLKGLTMFNEGLIEHGLHHRAELNGETVEQGIKREISDMCRLLLELNRIDESSKRTITEGMVKYAMGFYLLVRKNGGTENYSDLISSLNDYFYHMDDVYYGQLDGEVDDMVKLCDALNKQEI